MAAGSVTLNGLEDADLVIVFQHKAAHETIFTFNPQAMQSTQAQEVHGRAEQKTVYNNVILSWQLPAGLKAVIELLQKIEHHRHGSQPAAQQA